MNAQALLGLMTFLAKQPFILTSIRLDTPIDRDDLTEILQGMADSVRMLG
jgi:hypothetical protein